MNELSWLIYLAEVVGNLKATLVIVIAGFAILWFAAGGYWMTSSDYSDYKPIKPWQYNKYLIFATVMLIIVPSKTSLYAIAASQIGEQAITSIAGSKYMKALDAWVEAQLSEMVKTKDTSK